ncbi:putative RNA-directed DNA polymerase, eukaryota, reverse transcriptase zinc-binding domain protein [Tanacetum coccineum]
MTRLELFHLKTMWGNFNFDYACSMARGLIDLPIGGRLYTWMNKAGTQLSKLYRFLIPDEVWEILPDIRITALDRLWSDHTPILFHILKFDFGLIPFKLYNSWLSRDGFDDLIEKIIDDGIETPSDRDTRMQLLQEINKLDNFEALDLIQKAQIKWDIKGDENPKFFHGLINQKRRYQSIKGIMHDGVWITDLIHIKELFLNLFKDKFQVHDSQVVFPPLFHSTCLCPLDSEYLENHVSLDEIKSAIWNCGSNKAPGPNGFTFAFVKKYWDLIKMDFLEFVKSFFDSCKMPQGANSSFFTLILKVIKWFKKRRKKMLIFKLDFEKAFESVSWKSLDFILHSLGFGNKWRSWISACLHSSRAFVLVNGNPILKFSIKRGLRQGDPLSPFLFILVMEGLHCALSTVVSSNLIHGINLGSPDLTISHLFYANDVIITIEWNLGDLDNIIRVLHVFYLASGLKININKSNIYGIGVSDDEAPEIILKSLESLRTKFFWGGKDSKKLIWIKWANVLYSFKKGGLNIGSLKSFNLALLQKWHWRWIVDSSSFLHLKNIIPLNSFRFKAGCGTCIRFWKDIWIGDSLLNIHNNRLYRLELDKDCLIIDRIENGQWSWNWSKNDLGVCNTAYFRDLLIEISRVDISMVGDICIWSLAKDDIFSVKESRRVIDDKIIPSLATSTSWDKTLPVKDHKGCNWAEWLKSPLMIAGSGNH